MAAKKSPRHVRKSARKSAAEPLESEPVRLQKLLAAAGLASRRGAEELIRQERVSVNGRTAKIGDSALPSDVVALDGEKIAQEPLSYWIVHKPLGVLSTVSDPLKRRTILELLPERATRLYPVGRLDRESTGLVLLTNDGPLTQVLLHPSLGNEREYLVTARGAVSEKSLARLARGVHLEDGRTAPAVVKKVHYLEKQDMTSFSLTLTEGRKRQIRRALLALGHPVKKLVRTRMGPLRLGRLEPGAARELRSDELSGLRAHVARLQSERTPTTRRPRKGRAGPRPRG
jgi:23S rRNA pseudouridine2605 synthase